MKPQAGVKHLKKSESNTVHLFKHVFFFIWLVVEKPILQNVVVKHAFIFAKILGVNND